MINEGDAASWAASPRSVHQVKSGEVWREWLFAAVPPQRFGEHWEWLAALARCLRKWVHFCSAVLRECQAPLPSHICWGRPAWCVCRGELQLLPLLPWAGCGSDLPCRVGPHSFLVLQTLSKNVRARLQAVQGPGCHCRGRLRSCVRVRRDRNSLISHWVYLNSSFHSFNIYVLVWSSQYLSKGDVYKNEQTSKETLWRSLSFVDNIENENNQYFIIQILSIPL